jgi:hypothetical protein
MPYTPAPGSGGGGGSGEPAVDQTARTRANQAYTKAVEANQGLANHRVSTTPHPIYDDMPDLVLLIENGLI